MQIRPLHDRVIIKRLESERTTASGIVIPDNAAEKPDQGEVVAVGPGRRDEAGKLIEMGVKVGDRVLFGKYSGQSVKIDGEEFLVMREEDIMGVLARFQKEFLEIDIWLLRKFCSVTMQPPRWCAASIFWQMP